MRDLDRHLWFAEPGGPGPGCWRAPGPTLADIAVFPPVILCEEGGISRQDYPAVRRWTDRVKRIPGFVAMPGVFPGRPVICIETAADLWDTHHGLSHGSRHAGHGPDRHVRCRHPAGPSPSPRATRSCSSASRATRAPIRRRARPSGCPRRCAPSMRRACRAGRGTSSPARSRSRAPCRATRSKVRIDAVDFGADWGFCGFRPLAGTLPEDFPTRFLSHIGVDRDQRIGRLPSGLELALAPFFGLMGVAPPPVYGRISTIEPREHWRQPRQQGAGRRARSLYLPVWGAGRAVLGRGRPWCPGRRGSLHQRARGLPRRDLHA